MRRRFKSTIANPNSAKPSNLDSDEQPYTDGRDAKRVRFYDKGLDRAATRRSPSDVPKTSEYAYFKNVRNRNVNVQRSNTSEAQYHNNTESNNASDVRETTKSKDFEHSVSEERIRSSGQHTLVSPRVNLIFSTKQRSPLLSQHITPRGQHLPPEPLRETSEIPDSVCHTKQKSSFVSQNLTPERGMQHFPSSPLNKAVDISGNQCSKKGIFSEKRQRLLQWAVRTSFPGVQNIHPNGLDRSDLVASLLNRLFPKSDVSYGSSTERSDNSKSLLVHKSKDLEKEPKVPHTRNQDEHLPIILYDNSNKIVPSEWKIVESSFSSHKFGSGNLIEYDTMDFDRLNSSESVSQKQLADYHLKELDELCAPVEYARKEPCNRFLLDWNPERQKTGVYSSIVNRNAASLETSWHDDYQKIVDHEFEFDPKSLCSSSEFNALPNYESPNKLIQDFEPGLEHVKYSVAEPDQFALTLPYYPKDVSDLEDYRNAENALFSIDDMIARRDNHRSENRACEGRLKNDLWQNFLYASDIYEEDTTSVCQTWRFPFSEQYSFSGNSYDHYFSPSNNHEKYLDSLTNHTSLRSNFRKDRFEIDFYPDDDYKLEFGPSTSSNTFC